MPFQKTALAAALALAHFAPAFAASAPEVIHVESGDLTGYVKTVPGTTDRAEVFLGIPYAAAPTGENRWTSAKPAPAWSGVRQADIAPQPCRQSGSGSEDCLYVNVYRPRAPRPTRICPSRSTRTAAATRAALRANTTARALRPKTASS